MISPNERESAHEPIELFPLGRVVATPGALANIPIEEVQAALRLHHSGNWGDVDEHDWKENQLSLEHGFRLVSVYHSKAGTKFYVITERDRSVTTVLLPSEY